MLVLIRHQKQSNLGCNLLTLIAMSALLKGRRQYFKDSQPALLMASMAKRTAQTDCNFYLHLGNTGSGAVGVIEESNTMELEVLR